LLEGSKKVDAYQNGTVKALNRLIYEYDKDGEDSSGEESGDGRQSN